MIKLSRMTDYGVVVMAHLAGSATPRGDIDLVTAPEIAETTGLSLPTVSKLLKVLTNNGLAVSHRGAQGGYALARPAIGITVAEIIHAFDGPVAMASCVDGADECCELETTCPISRRWNRVNLAIRAALEEITLADMLLPDPFDECLTDAARSPGLGGPPLS